MFRPPQHRELKTVGSMTHMGLMMHIKTKNDDNDYYTYGYVYSHNGICIYVYDESSIGIDTKDSFLVFSNKTEFNIDHMARFNEYDHVFKKRDCDLKSNYIICRSRKSYDEDKDSEKLKEHIIKLMKVQMKGKSEKSKYGYLLMNSISFFVTTTVSEEMKENIISTLNESEEKLKEINTNMYNALIDHISKL